jgi:hypothetical protein
MSDMFLNPSGLVERRPKPTVSQRMASARGYAVSHGRLCTACLVGTWPMSMFRQAQTLCDTCQALEAEVTRRAGLKQRSAAGRIVGGSAPMWGLNDPDDQAWEPVRQANAYRSAQLARVFVRARSLGVVVLEEGRAGAPPSELVPFDALRAHDLIPDAHTDRVHRLAFWLRTLDPPGYGRRAVVLADVGPLVRWLRVKDRELRRAHARRELSRSVEDVRRASRAVASAAAGLVRAGLDVT